MHEEDRDRYNILIDRGNEVFERVQNNISNLNSRNITLIGIILPVISIALTVLLHLLQEEWEPSCVDSVLLIAFFIFLVISLAISILIFHPTDYKDLNVFEKPTFDKLIFNSEKDLLSHFLYHLGDVYRYNTDKYAKRMWWFTRALHLFIAANITFIVLIIKNIVWR